MILKLYKNDYTYNFANKILLIFVGLLSSTFLTRYLGVEYRGEYSYIIEVASIFTLILDFGISQSYSYFYKKKGIDSTYQKFLPIYLLQFLLNIVLVMLFSALIWEQKNLLYATMLLPFSVILRQFAGTMAVENVRAKILNDMFSAILKCFLLMLVLFFKSNIGANLLVVIIVTVVTHIFSIIYYIYIKPLNKTQISFDMTLMKSIINYSWMPMLSALLLTLNYSIDIILLRNMAPIKELSYYSVALGIVNYFWLIPDAMKEVLISRVSRADDNRDVEKVIKLSVYAVLFIILFFTIFGKYAIILLYGKDFSQSYGIALLLSIGAISMTLFKVISIVFLAEGKRSFYFLSLLVSVFINIILNLILIPLYGMYGAGIASVVSYTICGVAFSIKYLEDKNTNFRTVFLINKDDISLLLDFFHNKNKT